MGTTAREDISTTKKQNVNSKSVVVVPRNIVFAHQFVGGETSLNLLSLSTPSEMAANGFVNATAQEISAANLGVFGKILRLSSSRGVELKQFVHYVFANNNIVFVGAYRDAGGALAGEIIIGEIQVITSNANILGEAKKLSGTVELAVGQTTISVGDIFKVNANPSMQVGEIKIYRNGVQQFRNLGNATAVPSADGNYQEIDAGNGYGSQITFNQAPVGQPDAIYYEIGYSLSSGDVNLWSQIERLQAAIVSLGVDAAAGFHGDSDLTRYLTASPSEQDRRAFGAEVLSQRARISALESITELSVNIGNHSNNLTNTYLDVSGSSLIVPSGVWDLKFEGLLAVTNSAAGFSNVFANVVILNSLNVIVDDAIAIVGGSSQSAGQALIFHVSLTARGVPAGTYRLATRVNAGGTVQCNLGGNDYTGSLTGLDSRNIFYARKVGV